jgi:hypothetical protein
MADSKVSDLTTVPSPLTGSEQVLIVQSGTTYKVNANFISALGNGGALSGTYTFGGGGPGDIASMTFNNGFLTSVTLVP